MTLAAGLTLTPALLRLAGAATSWPSGTGRHHRGERARWERVAAVVARRPAAVLAAATLVLAVPAVGVTQMHQSFDIPSELPPDAGARQGFEARPATIPPARWPPSSWWSSTDGSILAGGRLEAIDRLTDALRHVPGVAEVRSITQPAGVPLTAHTISRLTIDERRRYGPAAVDLLALRVSSAGLAYGGTFTPPQLLLPWPTRVGDTWTGNWTTDDTRGTTGEYEAKVRLRFRSRRRDSHVGLVCAFLWPAADARRLLVEHPAGSVAANVRHGASSRQRGAGWRSPDHLRGGRGRHRFVGTTVERGVGVGVRAIEGAVFEVVRSRTPCLYDVLRFY